MVKFLLNRPVAVFMTTLALLLVGIASMLKIPTELMPDIAIPEITVQLNYPNNSARDIETNVVRPLRNQLLQVARLKNIHSETRDGYALIKLNFDYGTNTDFAFIETNEKIDAALQFLPRDLDRPRAIKASATDIPVVTLTVSQKTPYDELGFLELSEFTQTIIKRRLEQLPDIALADLSGFASPEVLIQPNMALIESLNISTETLRQAVVENNFELGNLIIQNGIYQYHLKFLNPLRSLDDVRKIPLNIEGKLFQLSDLATVTFQPQLKRGQVNFNGTPAILIKVIKQSDTKVSQLKERLNELLKSFEVEYPEIDIQVHQDQTKLLDVSLSNLKSSLLVGGLLAILIMFFFLKDIKSPIIIALSIPSSLIVSVFLMYLFGLSINIISLSGLILGVGMMIDNAIIIIDNITQKIERGNSYFEACALGVNEMIAPLITSVLTTCMIFIPLLFLSGITGALFYDQAIAVSIGLFSSLLVSIFLIPVLFLQLRKREFGNKFQLKVKTQNIEKAYKKWFLYFEKNRYIIWLSAIGLTLSTILLFIYLPYSKLPEFKENEAILQIDWNENITISENERRTNLLFQSLEENNKTFFIAEIGEQSFLLQNEQTQTFSQTKIYIKSENENNLYKIKNQLAENLRKYPNVLFDFKPQKNIFDYLFGTKEAYLTAQVFARNSLQIPPEENLFEIQHKLKGNFNPVPLNETAFINVDQEKLALYQVDYFTLVAQLKAAFDQNFVDDLKGSERFIPIKINYETAQLEETLSRLQVLNNHGTSIGVNQLITIRPTSSYTSIFADKAGEYLKFDMNDQAINANKIIDENTSQFREDSNYGVRFTGSWFEFSDLGGELVFVMVISILLLYFIMAAQFESLKQPLIILLELPISMGGGLLLLWLFGITFNVMSFIGIVVMSGIVINDSIIKLHTINLLRKEGMPLREAVLEGGRIRLNPIVMTSLTTILALAPFLFISGLGAELQKPLALTVIGGMIIGTFVSLYFLPMFYLLLESQKK